jgi:hypothetical protein
MTRDFICGGGSGAGPPAERRLAFESFAGQTVRIHGAWAAFKWAQFFAVVQLTAVPAVGQFFRWCNYWRRLLRRVVVLAIVHGGFFQTDWITAVRA